MTALPEFITFTGVDDDTDPAAMVALSDEYPIEWGILFSPKRQGAGRYPRLATVEWLVSEVLLTYSAHLCGGDAREVIESGASHHDLSGYFGRAQINTADPKVQPSLIGLWAREAGLRAILQCRGPFPDVHAVDVLYDASGGRGILPTSWPSGLDRLCGYAGGLSPDNVAAAVSVIGSRATRYWIDMESGVRDDRDRFDIGKCRAVCEAVYGVPARSAA